MDRHGVTAHVIAPVGGELRRRSQREIVERTLLTARSIEFDAIVVADKTTSSGDIKLALLMQEAYRHCKPIGAWGTGSAVLDDVGIPSEGPGVLIADSMTKSFTNELVAVLGLHRAWDRADLVMASVVPPAR
jgi:catalase